MHDIARRVILRLPVVLGVDLSITNEVLLVWAAAIVTFVVLTIACRRREPVARGCLQNAFEALIELIQREIVRGGVGREGGAWAPFLLALFFFILFGNLLGMVPLPRYFKAATANLSVTAGLALTVFALTVYINVARHGVSGFLRKFAPSGLPAWVMVLVVPIEVLSWLAKPISLAIRLFANMVTGHALILIFIGMEMAALWFLKWVPLAGAVAMGCFELFVAFIQAFIFAMLSGLYIHEALQEAH